MATATFLTTVSRKHRVQVDFPVNHMYRVPHDGLTVHKAGQYTLDGASVTMTKEQRLAWLNGRYEDGVKAGWPEFVVRDESRGNITIISETQRLDHGAGEDWDVYDLVIEWPVVATVRLTIEVDTELYPQDATEVFQAAADLAAAEWLAARPFTSM